MKPANKFFRNNLPLVMILTVFFLSVAAISVAQSKNESTVKVKIVKIADGDTTIIEKTMDEANVQDFTRQFQDVKGNNVQVMITIEDLEKDRKTKINRHSPCISILIWIVPQPIHLPRPLYSRQRFMKISPGTTACWRTSQRFWFQIWFWRWGLMNDFNFDFNIDTDKDGKRWS